MTKAQQPILFRTIATILRWGGWIVAAWLVFYLVRIGLEIFIQHRAIPLSLVALSIPYNLLTILVAGVAVSALVFIPAAFVVWAKPERQFWAEALPWWKGTIPAGTIGLVVGVVFGVLGRR